MGKIFTCLFIWAGKVVVIGAGYIFAAFCTAIGSTLAYLFLERFFKKEN